MAEADRIAFIVRYKGGYSALMYIDRWALESGEHVARTIARERQGDGSLPAGEIESLRRAND